MTPRTLITTLLAAVLLTTSCVRHGDPPASDFGDGHDVDTYGFDLSTCRIDRSSIVAGGLPRDGLPAMDHPEVLDRHQVEERNQTGRGKFLVPDDRVVGLAVGTEARAYPLRLLRWHEVVNDTLGGEPVLVTYSPLCDSVVAARRIAAGQEPEFGVSGLLHNSNPLLYDRREDLAESSLWSQLQMRAVAGPAAATGSALEVLPAALISWGQWLERHPETTVLAPDPTRKRLYKRDPYHSYFGSDLLRFPVDPQPPASDLHLKDRVVAITHGGETAVFALPHLATAAGVEHGTRQVTVGGAAMSIHFDRELGTSWVEPSRVLTGPLPVRHAFWFAWHAHYPETTLIR